MIDGNAENNPEQYPKAFYMPYWKSGIPGRGLKKTGG
jgi:hypothetical protein